MSNFTLNLSELNFNNQFEPVECPLPFDTLNADRTFLVLVICFIISWGFYLFILPKLLENSDYSKWFRIVIDKFVLTLSFLLMALCLNFWFYL